MKTCYVLFGLIHTERPGPLTIRECYEWADGSITTVPHPQQNKIDLIAEKINLKKGDKIVADGLNRIQDGAPIGGGQGGKKGEKGGADRKAG